MALKQSRKPVVSVPAVVRDSKPASDITPRMLSAKQAAAYCGCSLWHIRELYWGKTIAGFIAGRRLLIDRTSLDAYIDKRLQERMA